MKKEIDDKNKEILRIREDIERAERMLQDQEFSSISTE